jgi:regulatory protein SWI6
MSGILQSASMQFTQEARLTQYNIDRKNEAIAQLSALQKTEQQRLEGIRARMRARQDRAKRVSNLKRWVDLQRKSLAVSTDANLRDKRQIGYADIEGSNLAISASDLPSQLLVAGDHLIRKASDGPAYLNTPLPADAAFLAQTNTSTLANLPSIATLRSKVEVYTKINSKLAERSSMLKEKDGQLEVMYRKVVSLCTKVDEDRVDSVLDLLVQALESDPLEGADVGRVKEFLRKVEGVEA